MGAERPQLAVGTDELPIAEQDRDYRAKLEGSGGVVPYSYRLAEGELTVGDLAEPQTMTLAAVSKHIKVLERAGLVRQTIAGRRHMCRLEAAPLAPASAWLRFYERHWEERLDALEILFRTS